MVLGIDPGSTETGYVLLNDRQEIEAKGKVLNYEMLDILKIYINFYPGLEVAIEMIESYGMAVGREVFDTCIFIGKLTMICEINNQEYEYITRKDVKMNLCNSVKANDSNIMQALIDRFAAHDLKRGKGTKGNKDYFYGFKSDIWAAMGVTITYIDKKLRGEFEHE